jgi:putative FmdB family regulatory protein
MNFGNSNSKAPARQEQENTRKMPYYDYRCQDCRRMVRLYFTYTEYDQAEPRCSHCGSPNLRRHIGRVALSKSEESRLDALDSGQMLAGLDEEDPKSLGRFMRRMSSEMGEDLGDDFDEVVSRLESGESPESIEESMPELASDSDGLGGGDDFF